MVVGVSFSLKIREGKRKKIKEKGEEKKILWEIEEKLGGFPSFLNFDQCNYDNFKLKKSGKIYRVDGGK